MIRKEVEELLKEVNEKITEELSGGEAKDKVEDCLLYGCFILAELQWMQSRLKQILGEEKKDVERVF